MIDWANLLDLAAMAYTGMNPAMPFGEYTGPLYDQGYAVPDDPTRLVAPRWDGGWGQAGPGWKDRHGLSVPVSYEDPLEMSGLLEAIKSLSAGPLASGSITFSIDPTPNASPFFGLFATGGLVGQSIGYYGLTDRKAEKWPTKTSRRAEPIAAWKHASIALVNGVLRFKAGNGEAYDVEDVARCEHVEEGIEDPHPVPDPTGECRCCGFYGVIERTPEFHASGTYGCVTLQVEFYGRVIRHARGYRAEKQRVLAAYVGECGTCERPAEGFRIDFDDDFVPRCTQCTPFGLVSFADVSSRLGTEVRYDAGP